MNIISSDGSIQVTQTDCQVNLQTKPPAYSLNVMNSPSLSLTGNGGSLPLTGVVRLSVANGNTLLLNPDGLFVGTYSFTENPITAVNSSTIALGVSGIASHTITAALKISAVSGNALVVNSDGVFVPTGTNSGTYTDAQARNAIGSTAPLTYNNTTGIIGITKSNASASGYLSSTDWTSFNSKEPAIALGNTSQYWRGDKSWQVLNSSVVPESLNLYFTQSRARASISALAPITYSAVTGVIGAVQANAGQDGYLTSEDWSTFNSKISGATNVGSIQSIGVYKDVVTGGILEFRGIKGDGTTVISSLVGNDIVLSASSSIPTVNAGGDQNISLPTSTVTMAGIATTAQGTIVSNTWLQTSGPGGAVITDATNLNTTVTNLTQGTYVFRLVSVNSFGLVDTDDVIITVSSGAVTTDSIYIGAASVGTTPNQATILAGISSQQNGAFDVSADWTSFNGSPQYCWFAIPDLGTAYEKNQWYVTVINNGNIGGSDNLFDTPTTVVVNGVNYYVGITNYATQFDATCLLKKV